MGIRFQCPNGHKINVKAFLAGKRALCPKCGVKVVVPLENEGATTTPTSGSATGGGNGSGVAQTRTGSHVASTGGTAARASAPSAAPVSAHSAGAVVSSSFGADLSAAAATVSAPVGGPAVARPTSGGLDPIAEAPQAVWYVRPKTGGQYGPAPGDIFRQWITQRRVTADALVWRDGWTDWRLAGEVLPQLATTTAPALAGLAGMASPATPPVASTATSTATSTAAETVNATAARYVRSRRSKSSTIVAICFLAIVAISLVGVLIYVLNRP